MRLSARETLLTLSILQACILFQPVKMAMADKTPLPQSKTEIAGDYQQKLAEEEKRERNLRIELQKRKKDLNNTQDKLIALASKITNNERELQKLEKRISESETEYQNLATKLELDYGNIGDLILALQKIKRVPPEALLARPGSPLQTAQSAMLLKSSLPSLLEQADDLKKDIAKLKEIQSNLETDRQTLIEEKDSLNLKRKEMSALLEKRKKLYTETQDEHKEQKEILRKIAANANSLQELVKELENNKKRMETARLAHNAVISSPPPPPASSIKKPAPLKPKKPKPVNKRIKYPPSSGKAVFPVAGTIRVNYGETDELEATSHGITIDGHKGGIVVAPMTGEIRFAGKFKRFGQLIIIEHPGNYHSLVAGLARIDTVAGRSVKKGEPIGLLSDSEARLYYELRHKGVPVDPSINFGK